jgi:type IV secretion system protein VirB9
MVMNGPTIEPSVWDDGQFTYFRFPGNSRLPTFYVVNPDGTEAVASYTVDPVSSVVVVHQTAAEFRLRDGKKVACIKNKNWNPVGWNPGTGTISSTIVREPKDLSK